MAENVPVRCPSCRREHRFTAPSYPCVCGAPVAPRLDRDGTVTPVAHRVWQDDWVAVRCERCGRRGEWPRPEVGCPCGTVLRVPLAEGRWMPGGGGSTGRDRTSDDVLSPDGTTRQDTAADQGLRPGGTTGQDTTADGGLRRDRDITVDADAEAGREGATDPGRATRPHDAASAERVAASAYAEGAPASARSGDSAGADADVGAGAAAEAGGRGGAEAGSRGRAAAGSRSRGGADAVDRAGANPGDDAGGRSDAAAGGRGRTAAGSRSRGGADAVDRAGANPGDDAGGRGHAKAGGRGETAASSRSRGGANAVDRAGTDPGDAPGDDAGSRSDAAAESHGQAAASSRSRGDAVDRAWTDADDAAAAPRPPFRSVTIRTALDAVTAAALYLRWLGYRGVRRADQRPPSGIGLAARGVVALVDPAVRPATLRDVECLWLTAMTESADCLYFSLAGYADDARARADALGIPLFVLDLTGRPRPVNAPAGALDATGTENRAP